MRKRKRKSCWTYGSTGRLLACLAPIKSVRQSVFGVFLAQRRRKLLLLLLLCAPCSAANSTAQKLYNWNTLNTKVGAGWWKSRLSYLSCCDIHA